MEDKNQIRPLLPITASQKDLESVADALLSENPPGATVISTSNAPNMAGFIYVPSIKLYVAEQRSLQNNNWNQAHEELAKQKGKMLTIPQFEEFIKYLKHGYKDKRKAEAILDDVLTVRDPWRAEHLDAYFEEKNGVLHINYDHTFTGGKLKVGKSEPLKDYLTANKTPGIDLDDLLTKANKHGLPKPDFKQGELYYYAPVNGAVARFGANSGRAGLSCSGDPSGWDGRLGVRVAKILGGNK